MEFSYRLVSPPTEMQCPKIKLLNTIFKQIIILNKAL